MDPESEGAAPDMKIDHQLAVQKFMAAAAELGEREDSDAVLRPSSCGNCPARLWYDLRDRKAGLSREQRPDRYSWMALQGNFNEALVRLLLTKAGAQVLAAPDESTLAAVPDLTQPVWPFEVMPHIDGAILWPEVGITEWSILELKNPRVFAQIDLAMEGVYGDRTYWFQLVSYMMQSQHTLRAYAAVDPIWGSLEHLASRGLEHALFVTTAKDPSTTNMMFSGANKIAQYEATPEKMKPEQIAMAEKKAYRRGRFEMLGGLDIFFQVVSRDTAEVRDTWEEIMTLPKLILEAVTPPTAVHNSTLADGELNVECAAYCGHLEECRNEQLGLNLSGSIPPGFAASSTGN